MSIDGIPHSHQDPQQLGAENLLQKRSRRKKDSSCHIRELLPEETLSSPMDTVSPLRHPHGSTASARLPHRARAIFTVGNAKGLHTRPSTELVKCASGFRAQIMLRYQKVSVNAKSLLGILTLAAGKGSRIVIEAEGEDAQEAIDALLHLAHNRFFTNF